MIPTRSLAKSLSKAETKRLAFSKRLGAMSSANILLETSMAKTMSTPSRLTVSNCVPIFGFTKPITKQLKPRLSKTNFKKGLKRERLGLKASKILDEAKVAWVFFFQLLTHK